GTIINHLFVKSSFEGNLSLLCRSIMTSLDLPTSISFTNLFDLFDFLKKQNKPMLIVFDEYQYFKSSLKEGELDSYMQHIIDTLPDNIKLVLCGSYISIMKELLLEENPLFGRFTKVIRLEEFNYYDASKFYPNLNVRDKIRFYSVFGGSPYVLTNLDYSNSLEENIKNLLIDQNSLLRSYIENLMLKEIQKNYDVRILEVIGNGKKKYSEILNLLGLKDSGLLDKQLKNLISMETITKIFPINKPNDKKKQFYEIKDNLMRFYFTYIFANDSLITKFGKEEFLHKKINYTLNNYVSFRFEGIVNQYFVRLGHKGKLQNILDFGSFWYDDPKQGKNGQFDCVLKEEDGYVFFEAKFYDKPMTLDECKKEEAQIIELTDIFCKKIGFVSSSGFDFKEPKYTLIDGQQLYMD
ncbi:MAG: hypothetical protein K6C97_10720, partial [Treponema sp.]|nr:hypothetical protein [Treponema sp.]